MRSDAISSLTLLYQGHRWLKLSLPIDGRNCRELEGPTTIGSGWDSIGYRDPNSYISAYDHARNIFGNARASAIYAPKPKGGFRPVGVSVNDMSSMGRRGESIRMHNLVLDQTDRLLALILAGDRFRVDASLGSLVLHMASDRDYRDLSATPLPASEPYSPWWQYFDMIATNDFVENPQRMRATDMWAWVWVGR